MKITLGFISLAFALLLISGHGSFAQQQELENTSVRIIINDFQYTGDDSEYKRMASMLTEVLAYRFKGYPGADLHFNMPFDENYQEKNRLYYQSQDNRRSISDYDYIIYGDFSVYRDELYISPKIFDIDLNQNLPLQTITGNSESLFSTFDEAANEIFNKFIEITRVEAPAGLRFGFICDYSVTRRTKDVQLVYLKDLIIHVTNNIEAPGNVTIMPWREMQGFYCKPEINLLRVAEANNIDVVILSKFESIDKFIDLNTLIHIKGSDKELSLPVLSSSYYGSYDFEKFVTAEYQGFVDNILTDQGRWNLEPFMELDGNNDRLLLLGQDHASRGDYYLSNLMFRRILERGISTAEIHYNMGLNLADLNRVEEARLEFQKAANIDPGYAQAWTALGIVYTHLEAYERGIKSLERAKEIDPGNFHTTLWLGISYYKSKQTDRAIEVLEQALEMNPEDFEVYRYLGLAYLEKATHNISDNPEPFYDRAIELFKSFYKIDPAASENLYYLGYSLAEKGTWMYGKNDCKRALSYLEEAQQYYSFDYTYDNMLKCMLRERRYESARILTDRVVSSGIFSPDYIYYDNARMVRESSFDAGEFNETDLLEVLYYLNMHLRYNPGGFLAIYLKGNTYLNLGNIDRAIEYLEQAYEIMPEAVEYHLDLLEAYILANSFEQSINLYPGIMKYSKKREAFTPGNRATSLYLLITAKRMIGEPTDVEEENLHHMIDVQGVWINDWDYGSYQGWLENVDASQEKKEFLIELTEYMIAHSD